MKRRERLHVRMLYSVKEYKGFRWEEFTDFGIRPGESDFQLEIVQSEEN